MADQMITDIIIVNFSVRVLPELRCEILAETGLQYVKCKAVTLLSIS